MPIAISTICIAAERRAERLAHATTYKGYSQASSLQARVSACLKLDYPLLRFGRHRFEDYKLDANMARSITHNTRWRPKAFVDSRREPLTALGTLSPRHSACLSANGLSADASGIAMATLDNTVGKWMRCHFRSS
jgi:hypothetical protein